MKKLVLSIFALCLFSVFAFAQTESATKATEEAAPAIETVDADPDAEGAIIKFEKDLHNFGKIPFKGNGVYNFKFWNTGSDPLVIANAKGSCGCTVPNWPKEPVMPGQGAVINVRYDTKRVGPFTKTVTISSNAKTPSKVITIKGVVQAKEQVENLSPVKNENTAAPVENKN